MFKKILLLTLFGGGMLFAEMSVMEGTFAFSVDLRAEDRNLSVNNKNHALVKRGSELVIVDMKNNDILHELGEDVGASRFNVILNNTDHVARLRLSEGQYECHVWSPGRGWKKIFDLPSPGSWEIRAMNNGGDILVSSFGGTMIKDGISYYFWNRNEEKLVLQEPAIKKDMYQFYYLEEKTWIPVIGYRGDALKMLEIPKSDAPFNEGIQRHFAINSRGDLFGLYTEDRSSDDKLFFISGDKVMVSRFMDLKGPEGIYIGHKIQYALTSLSATYSMNGDRLVVARTPFSERMASLFFILPEMSDESVEEE